jgi:NADH pyrophosphatase NudC (nudix superfamily)
MKPFRYCPACASELADPDTEGASRCPSCGRAWYRNAAPTVGCTILEGGRALITVRGKDPYQGKVDLAGGFLKVDEDPIAGLKREASEELGIQIDVSFDDFIQAVPHRYGEDGDWVLAMGFVARLVSGTPVPADDVAAIKWVDRSEIDALDWAWPHDRDLVRKVLADDESRDG